MTFFLLLASVFVWLRVVMIGNDLDTLTEPFWNYLTWAFALNALALILYMTS